MLNPIDASLAPQKVLVIENSQSNLKLVSKLVQKANLIPIGANSLTEAKYRFNGEVPEDFLCAVVAYSLPDAPHGEAIDFTLQAFIPTIAVTDTVDNDTRSAILKREVVDYLIKENHQSFDYLSRLLSRLSKNKAIGVLITSEVRQRRAKLAALLRRHNFLVYEAKKTTEAQSQLAKHPHVRFILVDSALKGSHGVQCVAELRKAYSKDHIAILGMSDENTTLTSARYLKSGANDYIQLPVCHEEFFCRVMQNLELLENVETIHKAANTDYLTGLPNRRHFFYILNTQYLQRPLQQSLALMDLDFFKKVNDSYGHDAGDEVLKTIASLIQNHFPDIPVARFGGEEFCLYLPEMPVEVAVKRLEDFRQEVFATAVCIEGHQLSISTSIGLYSKPYASTEELLAEADRLLYQAKANGRNQVCFLKA